MATQTLCPSCYSIGDDVVHTGQVKEPTEETCDECGEEFRFNDYIYAVEV